MSSAQSKKKRTTNSLQHKTILHVLTGSIAAYKAGDLIQDLRDQGAKVLCVMTESAKQFVTPLTIRAISGQPVYHDFFSAETPYDVLHTSLAEQADLILVAPASANFIARLAAGFCDDLASCVILAAQSPVLLVPAMNDRMYEHPLTQENIRKLKSIGYQIMDPEVGHLVCGKEAIGHISGNAAILQAIRNSL